MNETWRVYRKFRLPLGFKCHSGVLLFRKLWGKNSPTFPERLLPQPFLKLRKKGSHLSEPLKAPSFFEMQIPYCCSVTPSNVITCSSHVGVDPKLPFSLQALPKHSKPLKP